MIPWWWIPVAFSVGYVIGVVHALVTDYFANKPKCKYFR